MSNSIWFIATVIRPWQRSQVSAAGLQEACSHFIAIIGFVSVLINGSMGLLKADGFWFAVKDATIPVIIGLAGSFLVSSVINYFVARAILVSPPGSEAFNQELGKMHWLGALIILVPNLIMMMALLWRLFVGIERLTGLKQDDIVAANE